MAQDGQVIPPVNPKCFDVCAGIAIGQSVQKSCEIVGIDPATFYRALQVSGELRDKYAGAKENRADTRFESIVDMLDEMKTGVIDPMMARVMLEAIKWQCGKEKSKVYGDSTTIKGDKDNPLTLQALSSALDDRVKGRIETDKT